MIVKLFYYPTDSNGRVPLWAAQRFAREAGETAESDGWVEHTPAPGTHTDGLEILAEAMRWASEGQAVRIEFN